MRYIRLELLTQAQQRRRRHRKKSRGNVWDAWGETLLQMLLLGLDLLLSISPSISVCTHALFCYCVFIIIVPVKKGFELQFLFAAPYVFGGGGGSIGSGTIIDENGTILTCAHNVVDFHNGGRMAPKGRVSTCFSLSISLSFGQTYQYHPVYPSI